MSITENSLFVRFFLSLWLCLKNAAANSALGRACDRLEGWFLRQAENSAICTFVWREGRIPRAWPHSIACRLFTAIINIPCALFKAVYRAGKRVWDASLFCRLIGALGGASFLFLGLFMMVMLMTPHAMWNNVYGLMGAVALTGLFVVGSASRPKHRLELDTLGDRRTALFLIMSDTDDSFNFLISMCYTQLFNLLCEKADDVYGGRLPVHVRCLIDECANIGQIPKMEKLVATIRSREISACLALQAQSQPKAIYKDNADTIIGNMDSSIFLGGKEPTTLKELEAVLGKETIDTYNTGESRGRETSHSLNYQKLGKALMSQDELAVMDGGKCILQLRGVRPFLSDKYDITQHPNYKYTADADPKNAFDIEGYLKARLKLKPNQVCDVYEIDAAAGE